MSRVQPATSLFPLMLLITISACAGRVDAASWVVEPDGSGDAPTIQAAIDAASPGDEILLSAGVFTGPGNRDIEGRGKALTIRGEGAAPSDCVIDCEGTVWPRHRGFYFHEGESAETVVENLSVKNGLAPGTRPNPWGGGILCVNSSPTIRNCRFISNQAEWGGGMLFWNSASAVIDCFVADNLATTNGGGIYCTTGAAPTFRGMTLVGNITEGRGGALVVNSCAPTMELSTIDHNTALSSGSFVWTLGPALLQVRNCIVTRGVSEGSTNIDCAGGNILFSCTNIWGHATGNWTSCAAGQDGQDGNFSADPRYCDPVGRNFTLAIDSPCAPDGNPDCGLIGAWPVACGGPVAVVPTTWGRLKANYR